MKLLHSPRPEMGTVLSYFIAQADDNVLDAKVGLTGREKRIVKQTWEIVRKDLVGTGVAIMTCYFTKYPQYQQVFPTFKDVPISELATNKKFQSHCQNIMTTLSNALGAIDDFELMEATLIATGERHGRRGQGKQEFDDLKGIIMDQLAKGLGVKFTTEVAHIWDKTIDSVFSIIFKGMEDKRS